MPDITNLVDAQAKVAAKTTATLVKQIIALWKIFGPSDWWNDSLVAGNAAKSATLVESALRKTRLDQRSYSQAIFKQMSIGLDRLPDLKNGYARSNVTPFEVYQRPATQYQWTLSQTKSIDEAWEESQIRAEDLAHDDLLRARMDEAQDLNLANKKVIGTRRMIHPELSKTGTCGLCLVASTQFYKKTVLLPIHGHCECTTLPITKDHDPGLKLNKEDLKAIYAAAGSSLAQDLINTRITVKDNGELGPLLVRQGQHFRTPEDAGRPAYVKQTPEMVRAAREKERDQINDSLATAEAQYDELLKTHEAGRGKALAQFRAIKNMKERLQSINVFLQTH